MPLRANLWPHRGRSRDLRDVGRSKRCGAERVDAACARALSLGTRSYGSVAAIPKNTQEKETAPTDPPGLFDENIRGPGYYHYRDWTHERILREAAAM
jgi:hypothetical protein